MARRRSDEIKNTFQAFDTLRSDYAAARESRYRRKRTGIPGSGAHADYHYTSETDYLRIMEYARDFVRNDVVVGQGVRRLVDNVVREGFTLDTHTGDAALDKMLVDRWRRWAEDPAACDVMGEMTFGEMEAHALQGHVVDGDIWALLTSEGPVQMIEAHRVRTPNGKTSTSIVHGVELDEFRRRTRIHVTAEDVGPTKRLSNTTRMQAYPIRDDSGQRVVLQVYRRDRVSQTRGLSYMAPIFDTIGMHDDIQFAKLVQQQAASCFAFIHKVADDLHGPMPTTGEASTETLADGSTRTIQGIAPGMEIQTRPGEEIQGFSPNIPNPEFFPHARLILEFIAINIGVPVAVLLLDPSDTNFSGWRGAIDQARMGFRRLQRLLIQRFHAPIFSWKVRQWIAEDADLLSAAESGRVDLFSHTWHPPGWDYIEPLKDASADLLRIRNCLTSQRRRCAERGTDWPVVAGEIVEDNALLIRAAWETSERLNTECPGLGVTWREVACLPTPDGVQVSIPTEGKGDGDASRPSDRKEPDDADQ